MLYVERKSKRESKREDQPQTNNDLYNEQTTINEGNPEKVCPRPFRPCSLSPLLSLDPNVS